MRATLDEMKESTVGATLLLINDFSAIRLNALLYVYDVCFVHAAVIMRPTETPKITRVYVINIASTLSERCRHEI